MSAECRALAWTGSTGTAGVNTAKAATITRTSRPTRSRTRHIWRLRATPTKSTRAVLLASKVLVSKEHRTRLDCELETRCIKSLIDSFCDLEDFCDSIFELLGDWVVIECNMSNIVYCVCLACLRVVYTPISCNLFSYLLRLIHVIMNK